MNESSSFPAMTVSSWIIVHVLVLGAAAASAALEVYLGFTLANEIRSGKPWQEWIAFPPAMVFLLGASATTAYYFFLGLAFRLEFGEKLGIFTILGQREAEWSEVGQFELLDTDAIRARIRWVMPIRIMLTDRTEYLIFASVSDAEAALRFVLSKPWSKDWTGAPWGCALPAAAILLGAFIAGAGIVLSIIAESNQWYFLAVGIAVGFAAIGYGSYHLIAQPIYYLPNVGRSSDNATRGNSPMKQTRGKIKGVRQAARMGRPKRVDLAGYVYHVLNRSNGRSPIFRKDADDEAYLRIATQALEYVPEMRPLASCVMPAKIKGS